MAVRDILDLDKPLAPLLVRYLYVIALALILLCTAIGVVRGAMMMTAPPRAPITATAEGMTAPQTMNGPRDFRERRNYRQGRGWMRDMAPPVRGGIRIVMALLCGLIALMLVRVLAELARAILALPRRAD